MTYVDKDLRFSDKQALATGATATISTTVLDLSNATDDNSIEMGVGNELVVQAVCTTNVTTAVWLKVEVLVDTLVSLASAPIIIGTTDEIPIATVNADKPIVVRLNPNPEINLGSGNARFLGVRYTTNANPGAGNMTADLVKDPHPHPSYYPTATTIL